MTQLAESLADKLAAETIKYIEKSGNEDIVSEISKTLGDSSQTLQEAFITSIRVQRAAIRASALIRKRMADLDTPKAPPKPE